MKKITLSIFGIILSTLMYAQQASIINGTVVKKALNKVYLYKVYNGKLSEIATSTPDSLGQFAFKFTPAYTGLYALGGSDSLALRTTKNFYFKGGDELNIELSNGDYTLVGENTKENLQMAKWHDRTKKMAAKAFGMTGRSTFVDFFPDVEELNEEIAGIKSAVNTGNPTFDKEFASIVDYDFAYIAIGYIYTPRPAHPGKEEMSDYYVNFNPDHFLKDDLLKFPYGNRLLNQLIFRKVDLSKKPDLDQQLSVIPTTALKGQYAINAMESTKSYSDYLAQYEKYSAYLILPEQKERAKRVELKLVDTKSGAPIIDFSFEDTKGTKLSLSSLKGKMVLMDVWATWCGPCKAEEPHWEKLVEKYEGKNITFLGISVDKDKDAWIKYNVDKKLKGLQVHAGPQNDLSKFYKITGIPRYLLIDKAGNIISVDSPRPSDPALIKLIDQGLAR
ncbi:TlpA family protein disulfide reductase [Sphingobacterium psychroaquaticum]|uniref:Thiol-disulfide isomerase or thioredoxin n=1 Tax=Sphingobacterium psychroaquaticum TaxID=561061 RepID=A0A1X7KQ72_9SPHI|nr:TlpA disulfide reductase family protein [Sphingobacterium psychroaquaticum]SMG43725.1 Thiol-disulfide isomerase or thioredoxin [Sphingobacterium psychroaquaticum]